MLVSWGMDTKAVTKKVLQWPLNDMLETNVLSLSNWTEDTKKKKKKRNDNFLSEKNTAVKLVNLGLEH